MGYQILTDDREDVSILFCNTSDEPLPLQAWRGPDSEAQAEDFLTFIDCDPRTLDNATLRQMQTEWWDLAFDEFENFQPVGRARV